MEEDLGIDPPYQQKVDASSPQEQPYEEPKRRPIEVSIISQPPPPEPPKVDTSNSHKDDTPRWKKIAEFTALGLGFVLAIIYFLQLRAMQGQLYEMRSSSGQVDQTICLSGNQNAAMRLQERDMRELARTTRDALVNVQRAIMSADAFTLSQVIENGRLTEYQISVDWKNSGTTPTKNLFIHANWHSGPLPFPNDFNFIDQWDPGAKHRNTPEFASPQKIIHGSGESIPLSAIEAVIDRRNYLVLWGTARYRDVFSGTEPHISEFCAVVTVFTGEPLTLGKAFGMRTRDCDTHNCHDEECTGNKRETPAAIEVPIDSPKPCPVPQAVPAKNWFWRLFE